MNLFRGDQAISVTADDRRHQIQASTQLGEQVTCPHRTIGAPKRNRHDPGLLSRIRLVSTCQHRLDLVGLTIIGGCRNIRLRRVAHGCSSVTESVLSGGSRRWRRPIPRPSRWRLEQKRGGSPFAQGNTAVGHIVGDHHGAGLSFDADGGKLRPNSHHRDHGPSRACRANRCPERVIQAARSAAVAAASPRSAGRSVLHCPCLLRSGRVCRPTSMQPRYQLSPEIRSNRAVSGRE